MMIYLAFQDFQLSFLQRSYATEVDIRKELPRKLKIESLPNYFPSRRIGPKPRQADSPHTTGLSGYQKCHGFTTENRQSIAAGGNWQSTDHPSSNPTHKVNGTTSLMGAACRAVDHVAEVMRFCALGIPLSSSDTNTSKFR
jgi:hypothetical protein